MKNPTKTLAFVAALLLLMGCDGGIDGLYPEYHLSKAYAEMDSATLMRNLDKAHSYASRTESQSILHYELVMIRRQQDTIIQLLRDRKEIGR